MTTRDLQGLSSLEFGQKFCKVPDGSGRLGALMFYPAVRPFFAAYDARDPVTGLPLFDRLALLLVKKAGKSTFGGELVTYELVAGSEPDREIIIVASDFEQSKNVVFASAARFINRHPWLSKNVRVLAHELIYKQTVTDPATGGRHMQEHIVRAVAARDVRSLHGVNPVLVVFDEFWAHQDYGIVEALAPSPTRRYSRHLILTYAGLRSQMREGNPLWDLWQTWQAGTDPRLFVLYIGGPDGWKKVPWIKPSFIESQRRQFAAVPSKFKRLWENEWSTDDAGSFLTGEEIASAIDSTLTEPERGEPSISYTIGVDLGLTFDWSAVVVSHIGPDHKLVVDAVRFWRGTRQRPVSIAAIEDEIIALSKRFRIGRCVLDQWQSHFLAERLHQRGLREVFTVAVDPARLDRMAVTLKRVFATRTIRIPRHPELVEQLETIVGVEQKRRDLVRFTSGSGQDAGKHDDLVVALCLSMEHQAESIGRVAMPQTWTSCDRVLNVAGFSPTDCFLVAPGATGFVPPGNSDPVCRECAGWKFLRRAYAEHIEAGGEAMSLRTFRGRLLDNDFVGLCRQRTWQEWYF
jgi:hypothetical protein